MIDLNRNIYFESRNIFMNLPGISKVLQSFSVIKLSLSKCIFQGLNYLTEPDLFISTFGLDILSYQIYLTFRVVS